MYIYRAKFKTDGLKRRGLTTDGSILVDRYLGLYRICGKNHADPSGDPHVLADLAACLCELNALHLLQSSWNKSPIVKLFIDELYLQASCGTIADALGSSFGGACVRWRAISRVNAVHPQRGHSKCLNYDVPTTSLALRAAHTPCGAGNRGEARLVLFH